jgi:hypothetical protein
LRIGVRVIQGGCRSTRGSGVVTQRVAPLMVSTATMAWSLAVSKNTSSGTAGLIQLRSMAEPSRRSHERMNEVSFSRRKLDAGTCLMVAGAEVSETVWGTSPRCSPHPPRKSARPAAKGRAPRRRAG